jgi:hypothetical protein
MQNIIVYIALGLAITYLVRKFIFPAKKKGNCKTNCNC